VRKPDLLAFSIQASQSLQSVRSNADSTISGGPFFRPGRDLADLSGLLRPALMRLQAGSSEYFPVNLPSESCSACSRNAVRGMASAIPLTGG